eukprot:scaffold26777_cov50-Cyclotella_meneghiniana.AAC.2
MAAPAPNLPPLIKASVQASTESISKHGFALKVGQEGAIKIYNIDPNSEASKTELTAGCEILTINDHRVASVDKANEMLTYYMEKKGAAKIMAGKGRRPRGTKYVLVKMTKDTSIFDGSNGVIAGMECEQRDGYVRVLSPPTSGFFHNVRISKNDCIWAINGVAVTTLNEIREQLKMATGKIVCILTYNSFRKLKTTIMSQVSYTTAGSDKWGNIFNSLGQDQSTRLEDVYVIQEKLGEGAFAVVKKATHKNSGGVYAVKIVNRSSLGKELEKNLKEEIRLLSEMQHDHIMCLHNVYVTINHFNLVTEFLEGGELFDRIVAKDTYTESEARDACKVIFDAMNYMAQKKVAHRDLKPENLLLQFKTSDSEIKIADFGFAKTAETEEFLSTICGTPGYVAPEVLCKKKYGTQCDMWSMGVIVYILLGGYPPFYAETEKELFRLTRMGNYEFHEESWDHISIGAKDLISILLQTNPKVRATAADVLEHKWMKAEKKSLKMMNLSKSQVALKSTLAKQKLKKAMLTVLATNKIAGGDGIFSGKKKIALNVE